MPSKYLFPLLSVLFCVVCPGQESAARSKRPAILILPGRGYSWECVSTASAPTGPWGSSRS